MGRLAIPWLATDLRVLAAQVVPQVRWPHQFDGATATTATVPAQTSYHVDGAAACRLVGPLSSSRHVDHSIGD